jgi:hypothetical protein
MKKTYPRPLAVHVSWRCLVAARGADPEAILLVAARCKSGVPYAMDGPEARHTRLGETPRSATVKRCGYAKNLSKEQRRKCSLPNSDYPRA